MDRQAINHYYEESVFQIRLRTAITLLAATGTSPEEALKAADKFVAALQSEDEKTLRAKFP